MIGFLAEQIGTNISNGCKFGFIITGTTLTVHKYIIVKYALFDNVTSNRLTQDFTINPALDTPIPLDFTNVAINRFSNINMFSAAFTQSEAVQIPIADLELQAKLVVTEYTYDSSTQTTVEVDTKEKIITVRNYTAFHFIDETLSYSSDFPIRDIKPVSTVAFANSFDSLLVDSRGFGAFNTCPIYVRYLGKSNNLIHAAAYDVVDCIKVIPINYFNLRYLSSFDIADLNNIRYCEIYCDSILIRNVSYIHCKIVPTYQLLYKNIHGGFSSLPLTNVKGMGLKGTSTEYFTKSTLNKSIHYNKKNKTKKETFASISLEVDTNLFIDDARRTELHLLNILDVANSNVAYLAVPKFTNPIVRFEIEEDLGNLEFSFIEVNIEPDINITKDSTIVITAEIKEQIANLI